MRLLVCGSRTFGIANEDVDEGTLAYKSKDQAEHEHQVLVRVLRGYWDTWLALQHAAGKIDTAFTVIDGAATGADTLAHEWALEYRNLRIATRRFPADWERDAGAAGFRRNRKMLLASKPHEVLAFTDKPLRESRGTYNMVALCQQGDVPVAVVEVRRW